MSETNDEFFIGWQGKAPPATARFLKNRTILFGVSAFVLALLFAGLQQTIGKAWFEFGNVREFQGLLVESPVPMLITNEADEQSGESVYLLVNPFKHGYPTELASQFHLKQVTVQGTLIYNESGGAMIEVVETLGRETKDSPPTLPVVKQESPIKLEGEIVDSKCWLGVMNPGALKPHRACAINCIRGGIPPLLLVDRKDQYLLLGPNGEPINESILDLVALPVSVSGTLVDYGALKVVKVDPSTISKLSD